MKISVVYKKGKALKTGGRSHLTTPHPKAMNIYTKSDIEVQKHEPCC